MAAESPVQAKDQESYKAIVAVLDEATAIFRSASALHADADAANQVPLLSLDPVQNGNALRLTLRSLEAIEVTSVDVLGDLLRDCAKIGGDLVIRVDRVAALLPSPPESESKRRRAFRRDWKANDLAVLALRLEQIIQRFCDIDGVTV